MADERHVYGSIAAATNEKDTEIAELRVTLRRQAQEIAKLRDTLEWAAMQEQQRVDALKRMHADEAGVLVTARVGAIAERDAAREALREACDLADYCEDVIDRIGQREDVSHGLVMQSMIDARPRPPRDGTPELRRRGGIDG